MMLLASPVRAEDATPPGKALYEARCASCHTNPGTSKAPPLSAMKTMPAERVFFAMSNGAMKSQAAGLAIPELIALASFASAGTQPDYVPTPAAMCAKRTVDAKPAVSGWGFDAQNSRALDAKQTRIDAAHVGKLQLKWAFGLPGVTDTRSQPVASADTLFVAASSGHVFALDRESGCVKWHTATPVRTSLTLGRLAADRAALFFGDMQGFVTAFDAQTGAIVWREHAGLFEASMLSGAVVQHDDVLIVPVSSIEVGLASNPQYECCKTHGAVRALKAATGEILWTASLTPDAQATTKSSAGTQQWGPSGVPVWGAPTIDAKRGLVYIGTGENYSEPATDRSDAIVALDLRTGAERWHFQGSAGDVYNTACDATPPGPNCPKVKGPDFDFGAAVIIARDARGRELLLAAQKSGDVYALSPDDGKVVWQKKVGTGSALGGVHWGIAAVDGRVYVPIADPPFPIPGYVSKAGMYALSIDDGATVWSHPIERGCETDLMAYFQRDKLYPACSFYFGPSAPPTVLPGLVVQGGLDGKIRVLGSDNGKELWTYDTMKDFETVNGVPAHGGSIDAAGAIAVGQMLYIQSGYSLFGQLPGNALLAFEVR